MTFKQHAYPLLIEPVASKSLILIIGFFHLASLASVALASLPLGVSAPAFGAIFISFIYQLRSCRYRVSISWDKEGDWRLCFENQPYVPVRLCGSSIVNRYFVWLHLRTENRRLVSIILPRDCLPTDAFRRLRVRLSIEGILRDDQN